MSELSLEVNGRKVSHDAPPRMHLGDFLREQARLTGTNLGCEHGVCGACTVLLDGKPVRSCITFAVTCEGRQVTTIEGYDNDPVMARLRAAFTAHHALQCGFCTPGMLTTARDIVLRLPDADEHRVRIELSGNLCRCTGYQGITAAVMSVLDSLHQQPDEAVETMRAAATGGKTALPPSKGPVAFTGFQVAHSIAEAAVSPSALSQAIKEPAIKEAAINEPAGKESRVKESAVKEPAADKQGKGSSIQGAFDVPFTASEVWAFMADLSAVASCLPGAVIEERDGDLVKGKIAIKFGPMAAAFKGSALLERDDAAMSGILRGSGQDTLSQSRAKGDVGYRLEALSNESTRVYVDLLYSLQGPLAQFSRSGLVQDFVRRMIIDFGRNVTLRLQRPVGTGEPLPQAEFSPFKMFLSVLWERIKIYFAGRR